MKDHYSHSATILPVKDVERSCTFYQDKLGFDVTFRWGTPTDYAVLKAGDISLHLTRGDGGTSSNAAHVAMMIFVERIDQLYATMQANEVTIKDPIGNREYGMRDFDILDPDGHTLSFGQSLDRT